MHLGITPFAATFSPNLCLRLPSYPSTFLSRALDCPSPSHCSGEEDVAGASDARLGMSAAHRAVLTLCACDAQYMDHLETAVNKTYPIVAISSIDT